MIPNFLKRHNAEKELLAEIEDKLSSTQYQRHAYHRQWFFNIAFLAGKHYVEYNQTTRLLHEITEVPTWRVRMTINKVREKTQARLAKLVKVRPAFDVIPASRDDREDVMQTPVAQKVLEYYEDELNNQSAMLDLWMWTVTCGTGYKHPYWDSEKKDLVNEVVSPFEMIFDPTAQSVKDAHWCIRLRAYRPDEIENRFNVKVKPDGEEMFFGPVETQLVNLMLKEPFKAESETDRCVTVRELWRRPDKNHPKGQHCFAVEKKLIHSEDLPDEYDGYLPYIRYRDMVIPGRFLGDSFIIDLIPINKEYNKIHSQIIEQKNLLCNPKKLDPAGSGIPDDAWTDEPGERIKYNPDAGVPSVLTPPGPSPVLFKILDVLRMEAMDIAAQHEVSKGQTPPGVTAGIAIRQLQESDDERLMPTLIDFGANFAEEGMMMLRILQERQTDKKLVNIVGKHKGYETLKWKGADLKGEYIIKIQPGSLYPRSPKLSWQSYVLDLFKTGVITDADTILRLLEISEARGEIGLDESQASVENDRMVRGERIVVERFENHIIHLRVHNEIRKSQEWDQLTEDIQIEFNTHCDMHKRLMQEQIAELRQLQGGQQWQPTPGAGSPRKVQEVGLLSED